MNEEIIEDLTEFLSSAHNEKRTLLLHELIWTLDAQSHLIPSVDEINKALSESDPFQIEREKNETHLVPSNDSQSGLITVADISAAMKLYKQTIDEILNR